MVQLSKLAKKLRVNKTKAETILWERLRANKLGVKIKRQVPISINVEGVNKLYIADFCSKSRKVVIEVDGEYHQLIKEQDNLRDELFEKNGYLVIRFTNKQVYESIDDVLSSILNMLNKDIN
ncbi:MAG: DUF559 domain-containing protein [Candidatus Margulisbacteria bacterium]|nr:DUF559 domain-containing protein [Candidatus Margulisiibacteriota bacterium]